MGERASVSPKALSGYATTSGYMAHSLGSLPLLTFYILFWKQFFTFFYNFSRWMPRLGYRWRTQQNAISTVNGRISRINRMLNAYCTFRLILKVCLVQGVYSIMQSIAHSFGNAVWLAFLCASDASSRWHIKLSSWSQHIKLSLSEDLTIVY